MASAIDKKWLTLMKFRIPSYTLRTMYGYHTCNAYMIISVIFNILFIYYDEKDIFNLR